MERDPRVDPQFGDELLCQASEAMVRFGYGQPFLARVVATGEYDGLATVEVLTRREVGRHWKHLSLSLDAYQRMAEGADVLMIGALAVDFAADGKSDDDER